MLLDGRPFERLDDLIAVLNGFVECLALIAAGEDDRGLFTQEHNLAQLLFGFLADDVEQESVVLVDLDLFGGQNVEAEAAVILHPLFHIGLQRLLLAQAVHAYGECWLLTIDRNGRFINGDKRRDFFGGRALHPCRVGRIDAETFRRIEKAGLL